MPFFNLLITSGSGALGQLALWIVLALLAEKHVHPPALACSPQSPVSQTASPTADSTNSLKEIEKLLTGLVVQEAGLEWSDDRNWGGQEKVWAGFRFRRDDGRLETERVWKNVNHGSWEKYGAKVRPGPENFRITLPQIETVPDGTSLITVNVRALLDITARHSQWSNGVQLYSISGIGWADIEVVIRVSVTTRPDYSELPPAIVIEPAVTDADILLHRFQLDRVSKLGGEFSQQVSRAAKKILDDKLADKKPDLVARLNRQIEKNREHLRFTIRDLELPEFVQFWNRVTEKQNTTPADR